MSIASEAGQTGSTQTARWLTRRRAVAVGAVVAAAAGGIVVVRHHDGTTWPVPHADASVAGLPVTVGTDVCGQGWTGGRTGRQTFAVWNNSIQGLEVYLQDPATQKVYLDVENLGPGVTRSASVTLGPGSYRFYCLPADSSPVAGRAERLAGTVPAAPTPGLMPISSAALTPATKAYQAWTVSRLPVLHRQVAQLAGDLHGGHIAAAKREWLAAHRTYETLGAAYDAFGDYDAAINGAPSSTTPPASDPQLQGFHKIEALLWGGAPAPEVGRYGDLLVKAVANLQRAFPQLEATMGTQDIGLRSHEILENAIQFELTGATDAGSHTNLATIDANLTGTREALRPIRSLLRGRDPDLAVTDTWLRRSQQLVRSFHRDGTWTPLSHLTTAQHEQLDAALTQTVEYLSEIAVITEPRRTNE